MKLCIINPDGIPVMCTEYVECFPTKEELKQMDSTRYTFLIDRKLTLLKKLIEIIENPEKEETNHTKTNNHLSKSLF